MQESMDGLTDLEKKAARASKAVGEAAGAAMRDFGAEAYNLISQMASDMAALGPEGEIWAPAIEGLGRLTQAVLNLGSVFAEVFANIKMERNVHCRYC